MPHNLLAQFAPKSLSAPKTSGLEEFLNGLSLAHDCPDAPLYAENLFQLEWASEADCHFKATERSKSLTFDAGFEVCTEVKSTNAPKIDFLGRPYNAYKPELGGTDGETCSTEQSDIYSDRM
jgi:hypothetical protein